jgi:hypothetical protein
MKEGFMASQTTLLTAHTSFIIHKTQRPNVLGTVSFEFQCYFYTIRFMIVKGPRILYIYNKSHNNYRAMSRFNEMVQNFKSCLTEARQSESDSPFCDGWKSGNYKDQYTSSANGIPQAES